jgi:hypothetical protein
MRLIGRVERRCRLLRVLHRGKGCLTKDLILNGMPNTERSVEKIRMNDAKACDGFWWMLVMSGTLGRPGTGIYLHDVGGREPPQIYDRKSVCGVVAVSSRSKPSNGGLLKDKADSEIVPVRERHEHGHDGFQPRGGSAC